MPMNNSLKEQVRRNLVALISLVVAISSLSYNTWRNEQSEYNRTQRLVSLEVLMRLGDLQQLVYHHHWDKDFENRGNLRTGWTIVLVTNLVQQARRLADRTAFFLMGSCIEVGDTEDLFTGQVEDQRTTDYIAGRFG